MERRACRDRWRVRSSGRRRRSFAHAVPGQLLRAVHRGVRDPFSHDTAVPPYPRAGRPDSGRAPPCSAIRARRDQHRAVEQGVLIRHTRAVGNVVCAHGSIVLQHTCRAEPGRRRDRCGSLRRNHRRSQRRQLPRAGQDRRPARTQAGSAGHSSGLRRCGCARIGIELAEQHLYGDGVCKPGLHRVGGEPKRDMGRIRSVACRCPNVHGSVTAVPHAVPRRGSDHSRVDGRCMGLPRDVLGCPRCGSRGLRNPLCCSARAAQLAERRDRCPGARPGTRLRTGTMRGCRSSLGAKPGTPKEPVLHFAPPEYGLR